MPSLVSHSLPSTLGRLLHEDSLCITWINSTGVLSPLWNHILRHLSDSLIPSRLPNTIQALHFLNQNQDLSDFAPFTCYHPMTHPSVSSPSSIVLLNFFFENGVPEFSCIFLWIRWTMTRGSSAPWHRSRRRLSCMLAWHLAEQSTPDRIPESFMRDSQVLQLILTNDPTF